MICFNMLVENIRMRICIGKWIISQIWSYKSYEYQLWLVLKDKLGLASQAAFVNIQEYLRNLIIQKGTHLILD